MEMQLALERFELVMRERFPEQLATLSPGLDDDAIRGLRSGLAPYELPEQVEALYRWRGGGGHSLFGGWAQQTTEQLLQRRTFGITKMEEPPLWIQGFDDQILSVVSLDLPGQHPFDTSVWYGHTHDAWLYRLFDSIADLLHVVADAADSGQLVDFHGGLRLRSAPQDGRPWAESLDSHGWTPLRLVRSPAAYSYPEPPPGTEVSRFPDDCWPPEWAPRSIWTGHRGSRGPVV